MGKSPPELAALLGSRICHDLISPIGAINNGLELLDMLAAGVQGPEMALVRDSVRNASARIRFFRVAYGLAEPDQRIGAAEIRGILQEITEGGRLVVHWEPDEDVARPDAQLVFLAIQCLERALPHGGQIVVTHRDGRWQVVADGERLKLEPEIWGTLQSDGPAEVDSPALVQFHLLPIFAARAGRTLEVKASPTRVTLVV